MWTDLAADIGDLFEPEPRIEPAYRPRERATTWRDRERWKRRNKANRERAKADPEVRAEFTRRKRESRARQRSNRSA